MIILASYCLVVAKSRVQAIDLGPGTRQALGVMSESEGRSTRQGDRVQSLLSKKSPLLSTSKAIKPRTQEKHGGPCCPLVEEMRRRKAASSYCLACSSEGRLLTRSSRQHSAAFAAVF